MEQPTPKLLIIEDEPVTRQQLKAHFENEGYLVTTRGDADDAERLILNEKIDICLLEGGLIFVAGE